MNRAWVTIAVWLVALTVGCANRRAAPAAEPPVLPPPLEIDAQASAVQQMYESGRYDEVLSRVSATAEGEVAPEDLWLAAHSHLRKGQNAEAAQLFTRLGATGHPGWQAASQIALAELQDDAAAADQARAAAAAHPDDPHVQYELGLAQFRREAFAPAAQAFERAIAADPHFAYAHYYAGLAYDRLKRTDLMANQFEMFLRLAPQAPERPGVESILRTVRRRD